MTYQRDTSCLERSLAGNNITSYIIYWHLSLICLLLIILLLSALLVPELESRLLTDGAIHRAAVKAFTSILSSRFHVTTSQLEARKIDTEFLSHVHCMLSILDSQ